MYRFLPVLFLALRYDWTVCSFKSLWTSFHRNMANELKSFWIRSNSIYNRVPNLALLQYLSYSYRNLQWAYTTTTQLLTSIAVENMFVNGQRIKWAKDNGLLLYNIRNFNKIAGRLCVLRNTIECHGLCSVLLCIQQKYNNKSWNTQISHWTPLLDYIKYIIKCMTLFILFYYSLCQLH